MATVSVMRREWKCIVAKDREIEVVELLWIWGVQILREGGETKVIRGVTLYI